MKSALIIAAAIVCLVLTGLVTYNLYQRNIAMESSSALAMTVTTDVLINWNPDTVREHATNELRAKASAASMQQRYTPLSRRLGALREINDIQYDIDMPAWWQLDGDAIAIYTMRARFESEVATIRITLIRQQGHWLISDFHIQPPAIAS